MNRVKGVQKMKCAKFAAVLVLVAGLAACSVYTASPKMNYYHGRNVPEGYISVARASAQEIEFVIRVEFKEPKLYHIVLDGNEPVAEGWYQTSITVGQLYTVVMKPKKGLSFETGKTYRLCIGAENPQEVQMYSSNYRCTVEFTFVFEPK